MLESLCEEDRDREGLQAFTTACGGSHKSNFLLIMHTQIKAVVIKTLWVEFEMTRGPLGVPCYMACRGYENRVVMSQQIDTSHSELIRSVV